jgi:hypothetical protein
MEVDRFANPIDLLLPKDGFPVQGAPRGAERRPKAMTDEEWDQEVERVHGATCRLINAIESDYGLDPNEQFHVACGIVMNLAVKLHGKVSPSPQAVCAFGGGSRVRGEIPRGGHRRVTTTASGHRIFGRWPLTKARIPKVRKLVRELRREFPEAKVEITGKTHYRLRFPNGETVGVSSTPSDRREMRNVRAKVRRVLDRDQF